MHEEYANIGDIKDKVIEEIGELLMAYGKMGRFGVMSKHPKDPNGMTNVEQLIMECEDVLTRVTELKAHAYTLLEDGKFEESVEKENIATISMLESMTHADSTGHDILDLIDPDSND
tara:strand:+ start:257 stop:607 length:351 start_codon:yes stop_codon:yes gene_type:complete